ncbi:MAG TPA: LysE family transporter [Thermodesulfovibrionales bacterium]|nr:LysE family transporter [Thermodesulfovibrionales bacterium]
MGLFLIGVSSFIIALSGALVPGPLFSITIAESAKRGASAGPLIILGHGILELVLIILLVMGITPLLTAPATRMSIISIGGLLLIYMGYRLIKDGRTAKLPASHDGGSRGLNPVLSGIIGSISNPYWSIWWVTIGLGYLVSSLKFGMPGLAVFFIGHIMADLGWYSLISFAVARGKRLIGDRGYRFLLCSCGIFLVFFGVWFLKGLGGDL